MKLFFCTPCKEETLKYHRNKAKKPHKIFVLCGKRIFDIFALFLMKGSALEHLFFDNIKNKFIIKAIRKDKIAGE